MSTNHIPLEILFGNPSIAGVKISPDGSMLSFLQPDSNNKLQVWVMAVNSTTKNATQATHDNKRSILQYFWNQDSQHI